MLFACHTYNNSIGNFGAGMSQGDPRVRFCRQCGAPLEMRVPAGEREWRPVCTACSSVDYANPKLVLSPSTPCLCAVSAPWRPLACGSRHKQHCVPHQLSGAFL